MNCYYCGKLLTNTDPKPLPTNHPTAIRCAECDVDYGYVLERQQRPLLSLLTKVIKSKLSHDRRGFQIMARKMVEADPDCLWKVKMEQGDYARAGGDVECEHCRQTYYEHPELPGFPTFHLICSGNIVKT